MTEIRVKLSIRNGVSFQVQNIDVEIWQANTRFLMPKIHKNNTQKINLKKYFRKGWNASDMLTGTSKNKTFNKIKKKIINT